MSPRKASLCAAVERAAREAKLQLSAEQREKVWQLHVALQERGGVILVGASRSGKTTVWKLLQRSLALLQAYLVALSSPSAALMAFREPSVHIMCPTAMEKRRFVGWMDVKTGEWHDGVLAQAARSVTRDSETQAQWIVCDGDIDPEWMESLNSVLDDNRHPTIDGCRPSLENRRHFVCLGC